MGNIRAAETDRCFPEQDTFWSLWLHLLTQLGTNMALQICAEGISELQRARSL